MNTKVLVFPYDTNPYQELLYAQMKQVEKKYLTGITKSRSLNNLLLPFQIVYFRLIGFRIFHLHWAYGFTFPGENKISLTLSTLYYYFMLLVVKFCGYKVVWTVHNLLPHKRLFLDDRKARIFLSKIVDTKIVHSEVTIAEMSDMGMDTTSTVTIPHGNYIGSYKNKISQTESRKKLGIDDKDFVFLFFGNGKKYKGVEKLVEEFKKINIPNSKLVVAGKLESSSLFINEVKNVVFFDKYIPNDEVQLFFNASNLAVYPFSKVTTSGSVLLSLSFGKAIIYPLIGNLTDLPKNIGIPYSADDTDGLKNSLLWAYKNKKEIKQQNENAYKYAKTLDWKVIADKTESVYSELLS